jgi:hypothetical protein
MTVCGRITRGEPPFCSPDLADWLRWTREQNKQFCAPLPVATHDLRTQALCVEATQFARKTKGL